MKCELLSGLSVVLDAAATADKCGSVPKIIPILLSEASLNLQTVQFQANLFCVNTWRHVGSRDELTSFLYTGTLRKPVLDIYPKFLFAQIQQGNKVSQIRVFVCTCKCQEPPSAEGKPAGVSGGPCKCRSYFALLSYSTHHAYNNWQHFSSRRNPPFERGNIVATACNPSSQIASSLNQS